MTARPEGLSAYIAVTAAYWAFMLTDGALRMLVLLHFHTLGFSPVQLAYLFVLYEIAGIVTNLSAGWIAARFGLTSTLYAGLGLQVVALLALAAWFKLVLLPTPDYSDLDGFHPFKSAAMQREAFELLERQAARWPVPTRPTTHRRASMASRGPGSSAGAARARSTAPAACASTG